MIIVFMLIGALLVYLIMEYIYQKKWNKNLTVVIRFSKNNITAGEEAELIEVVTNRKWLPLPYINVKYQVDRSIVFEDGTDNFAVSDMVYRNDIFSLLMNQRITRRTRIACNRRGVYIIDKAQMVSTGMFMNDVMVADVKQSAELVVYPERADVEGLEVTYNKLMGNIERNRHLYEDPFAFRGIRDYVSTDALSAVNWKASARTGQLMVNQYNETTSQQVCILLNLEPEGALVRENLSEASISIASGLAQKLIESGIQVSMISNGADIVTREPVNAEAASGFSHIDTINNLLARIDLKAGQIDFGKILLDMDSDNKGVIYCMISQNRRADLQHKFNRLAGTTEGSVWIAPYLKDEEIMIKDANAHYIGWEVDCHAN